MNIDSMAFPTDCSDATRAAIRLLNILAEHPRDSAFTVLLSQADFKALKSDMGDDDGHQIGADLAHIAWRDHVTDGTLLVMAAGNLYGWFDVETGEYWEAPKTFSKIGLDSGLVLEA
jgi:hypothetical protein